MADSEFWQALSISFRQLLASCDQPLSVEWLSVRPPPVEGRRDAWAMFGEGGGPNCAKQFYELAAKGGEKLSPASANKAERWLDSLSGFSKPLPPKDGGRGTDSRFEDVVRLSAKYCEYLAGTETAEEQPSFANFEIPNYRYFPTHLWQKQGPKQWARFRFLQACERLRIPSDLWPKFTNLGLPRQQQFRFTTQDTFSIPPFFPLSESEAEWRERVQQSFEKFLDMHTANFVARFQEELDNGTVKKVKTPRGRIPLTLRYEWAVRKYCLKEAYKSMATDECTPDQIRKVVARIFEEIELKDRT